MTATDGRSRPVFADGATPDDPVELPPVELQLSRPYVELPGDGTRGGPLRMPRFTPKPSFTPKPNAAPTQDAARRPRRPARRFDQSARAIIGDEIRIPIMWCQFGTCIARYTHRDALGERDLRARALAAGWRYDALGRLACPDCAQLDPTFWATRAPTPVTGHRTWAS